METEGFQVVASDGTQLSGKSWIPAEDPVGVVCLVHGLGDHIGRWNDVAEWFCQAKLVFVGLDLRGHGQSSGLRGHIPSLNQILDDIEELLMVARKDYLDLPIFLYGHSMGGNLVAGYLRNRPTSEIRGAILTSPWFRLVNSPSQSMLRLARFMDRFWPRFQKDNGIDVSGLSRDPQVERCYKDDPLVHTKITARMAMENFRSANQALKSTLPTGPPVLVMHGEADPITDPGASKEFCQKNAGTTQLRLWPEALHELHNESSPTREEALNVLVDWSLELAGVKSSPATL